MHSEGDRPGGHWLGAQRTQLFLNFWPLINFYWWHLKGYMSIALRGGHNVYLYIRRPVGMPHSSRTHCISAG
jgi:hypothetical protein